MKTTIFPNNEKIDFSKKLNIKFGIDPTSDKLHLGHLISLFEVKKLWEQGHCIDIVLGTFTAQLGDPSGKDVMRPILSSEETEKNADKILRQVARIFGDPNSNHPNFNNIRIHRNADWFGVMNVIKMTSILSKFTTTQLLARDSFQKRIENKNPIGMHELIVPVLQGYDSMTLCTNVEIGGTDQVFNFGITRDVQRAHGQEPEICILMPILNGTDGRKMSKSFDNCIFINDTPNDVFGKAMSISDELMQEWWPIFFDIEIINMNSPLYEKKKLAFKITSLIWSFKDADMALEHFESVIQNKKLPEEMIEISVLEGISVLNIVTQLRKCSKNEARRLIDSKAVKLMTEFGDNTVLEDGNTTILTPGVIIKVGKRDFAKLI